MVTIPTAEPSEITAGDLIQWNKTLPDYPANAGWVLSYTLLNATTKITIPSTASGSDFAISVAAATSAGFVPGTYQWQAAVTNGAQRFTVDSGEIKINANFSALSILDTRSHARKVLDAINAVIENRATLDQQQYTIANRSLQRTPLADLMKFRAQYAAMVKAEENAEAQANGKFGKNRILIRG